jgi:hypothetical protein
MVWMVLVVGIALTIDIAGSSRRRVQAISSQTNIFSAVNLVRRALRTVFKRQIGALTFQATPIPGARIAIVAQRTFLDTRPGLADWCVGAGEAIIT